MKKIKKILVCIFLILAISGNSAYSTYAAAEAGALTVVGGSIAAGGIGAAIAAIAPPALIIIGLAMAAQGIYVHVTEESERLGMTKTDYIGAKLTEFALASGRQYSDVCNDIVDGSSVTQSGGIALSVAASKTVYQFMNSLVANDEILEPVMSEGKYISINGELFPVLEYNEVCDVMKFREAPMTITNLTEDAKIAVFLARQGSRYDLGFFSDERSIGFQLAFNGASGSSSGGATLSDANGIYYGSTTIPWSTVNTTETYVPILEWASMEDVALSMDGNFNVVSVETSIPDDTFVSSGAVDTSVYNPAEGKAVVLNPGLDIPSIENLYGKTGTISIDNYLETLTRALNGVEDNTISINNSLTGVLDTVAVGTYNPVGSATVAQEDEEELPLVLTPVIDTTLSPTGADAEEAIQNLQFDLTAIFPFCIPFDIYTLIQKFDVAPVAPAMHIVIPLGGLGEDLEFDLDLAPWETVARVLRTMELIAFVVGLAMVTRNIIRG